MNPNPFWQNIFRNQADQQTLAYFLNQIPIFSKLSRRELKFLEKIVHIRNFSADEMVFSAGDIGSGMYIIRSGQIQILSVDNNGKELEQAILEPGDFFGEVALTGTRPRTAGARATKASSLVGLFRSDILEATIRHPAPTAKILFGLNRVLADRLHQCSQQLELLQSTLTAPQEPNNE
ncbi:MAG TPA: cyclic nucleotide-binding domain-containing protein [Pelovirga sp.]|nr:cyclic nucleotide-binding domain-containing protein [Pelovirga sp.]